MEAVILIVGHRGTGKTELLRRLAAVAPVYDLDEEMEKSTGRKLSAVFQEGEANFRKLERETLKALMATAKKPAIIALGAGFEGPLPEGTYRVWVRRVTDSFGRSFLNRPRLNPNRSPFQEYLDRWPAREERYRSWMNEELCLPEGYEGGLENFFAKETRWQIPYDLTVLPENFRDWNSYRLRRLDWGFRRLELRDDLLNAVQMKEALATLPKERVLYSIRRTDSEVPHELAIDWPVDLGPPPSWSTVVSLHQREPQLAVTLKRLSTHKAPILKLAVEINSFEELEEGHRWWLENPEGRTFLPRSQRGRWRWYRSLFGPRMPLHFIREGEGSSLDQPLLWQTQLQAPLATHFAAVLGSPVDASRSPMEHNSYFAAKGMPFVSIEVNEDEYEKAWPVLVRLGLTHAAVTSPLKKLAAKFATKPTADVVDLQTANTLYVRGPDVYAHNTDWMALYGIRGENPPAKDVWVWGAGGMKAAVEKVWPEAHVISARQGSGENIEAKDPDLLIWATSRSRPFRWPAVKPKRILDLNYSDDSPGLEYAVKENLPYQSGLKMFKLQAQFQREFWETHAR
jgi:shikimate 5-dehydrogenase